MLTVSLTEQDGVPGRVCTRCRRWKPSVDFDRSSRSACGLYSRCKECRGRVAYGQPDGRSTKLIEDRTGESYGYLTVLKYAGRNPRTKEREHLWLCRCRCGREKTVSVKYLRNKHASSCGCLARVGLRYGGENALPEGESSFNQLLGSYRKSARQRGHTFRLTVEEFRTIISSPCHYCGREPSQYAPCAKGTNGTYTYTGIDRVDNTVGYETGNCVPCCKHCNTAKGTMTIEQFLEWVCAVYAYVAAKSARFEHGENGAPR